MRARQVWTQAGAALAVALPMAAGAQAPAPDWPLVGRQGMVRVVVVPEAQAGDRKAYEGWIGRHCPKDETCFVNFYTNTRNVPVAIPLPDAIVDEATATFRRSMKTGMEMFRFSCRLKVANEPCF